MNSALQLAIVSLLTNPNDRRCASLFEGFGVRHWSACLPWADTRGVTVYLHKAICDAGIDGLIPASILHRLEKNAVDNRARNAEMLAHFHEINLAFDEAGIRFCNHKGFTLVPDFCAEIWLRHQADFDFIVCNSQCGDAAAVLKKFGYGIQQISDREWLLKTYAERLPSRQDIFALNSHRSVEFHFKIGVTESSVFETDSLLVRCNRRKIGGITVPVLSDADQFIDQTGHLFQHLQSEWTRLSWLLELQRWLASHEGESALWDEILRLTSYCAQSRLAIGTCLLIVQKLFGYSPRNLRSREFIQSVPPGVHRWIGEFGEATFLTQYPGSKNYIFLLRELGRDRDLPTFRQQLVPLHRLPTVVTKTESWSLHNHFDQLSFGLLRARFHAREAFRFWRANQAWSRNR